MEQEELRKSLNNRIPAIPQIIALVLLAATAISMYLAAMMTVVIR